MTTEKKEELKRENSFSMTLKHEEEKEGKKVMVEDKERTEIKFVLDFSKLSREQIAAYAEKEVIRILNAAVRSGEKKVEDLQGKEIEVPVLVIGERGRGKVTVEKARAVFAESLGLTVDELNAYIAKVKGAAK